MVKYEMKISFLIEDTENTDENNNPTMSMEDTTINMDFEWAQIQQQKILDAIKANDKFVVITSSKEKRTDYSSVMLMTDNIRRIDIDPSEDDNEYI